VGKTFKSLNLPKAPALQPAPQPLPESSPSFKNLTPSFKKLTLTPAPALGSAPVVAAVPNPPQFQSNSRSKIDILFEKAQQIDSVTASDFWFKSKLQSLMQTPPIEWIKWGSQHIDGLSKFSDLQVGVSKTLNRLEVAKWVDDTLQASMKKRGFLDRMMNGNETPVYFESRLNQIVAELTPTITELSNVRELVKDKIKDLQIYALAIQVAGESVTDPLHQQIATTRWKTLLSSLQNAIMIDQTAEMSIKQVVKFIQDIDQLRSVTIPAWKLVFAQSQKP